MNNPQELVLKIKAACLDSLPFKLWPDTNLVFNFSMVTASHAMGLWLDSTFPILAFGGSGPIWASMWNNNIVHQTSLQCLLLNDPTGTTAKLLPPHPHQASAFRSTCHITSQDGPPLQTLGDFQIRGKPTLFQLPLEPECLAPSWPLGYWAASDQPPSSHNTSLLSSRRVSHRKVGRRACNTSWVEDSFLFDTLSSAPSWFLRGDLR